MNPLSVIEIVKWFNNKECLFHYCKENNGIYELDRNTNTVERVRELRIAKYYYELTVDFYPLNFEIKAEEIKLAVLYLANFNKTTSLRELGRLYNLLEDPDYYDQ